MAKRIKNIDEAEIAIVEWWVSLGALVQQHPGNPDAVALRAASVYDELCRRICEDMPPAQWRPLYDRMKARHEVRRVTDRIGDKPILTLLLDMIDLRASMGIPSPGPTPGQRWRERHRAA